MGWLLHAWHHRAFVLPSGNSPVILAYIDPGSGALVWQAIVAGLVGVSYYFRKYFARFFGKSTPQDPPPPEERR
jgi:hypothetical protein